MCSTTSKEEIVFKKNRFLLEISYEWKPPSGFFFSGDRAGIKNNDLDIALMYSPTPCPAGALFTRNNFPGAPLLVAKKNIFVGRSAKLQAIIINSKNANVYTGKIGEQDVITISKKVAKELNIKPWQKVMMCSTGIIGKRLPVEKIEKKIADLCQKLNSEEDNVKDFSTAILTTDRKKKWVRARLTLLGKEEQSIEIFGIAKGSGMIEPNMATMLAYLFTDAKISSQQISTLLKKSNKKSFDCLSVDGDTSTSDTVVMMANGNSGHDSWPMECLQAAVDAVCVDLAYQIAADGEGCNKIIKLSISGAKNEKIANLYGKSVINSLLFKTAVEGSDPNWGRIVMALGKVWQYPIKPSELHIFFGEEKNIVEMNCENCTDEKILNKVKQALSTQQVYIHICVGHGTTKKTFLGNSLSTAYVRFNADYTS